MPEEQKHDIPEGFKSLLEQQQKKLGLSLRKLAKKAGMSVSFLSRILNGERNLPGDEEILKLAVALEIKPPERLLIEAGRIPESKPRMIPLLRAASDLTAAEIDQVRKAAEKIAKVRKRKKKKSK